MGKIPKESFDEARKRSHYLEIYERARFKDWGWLRSCRASLERIVTPCFPKNEPLMKLVGSSATGTMRCGEEDLDFAVAFQSPISNERFMKIIRETGLEITDVNQNRRYGYLKISGRHKGMGFVLVPMKHPNGRIQIYEQDAFYHPDFIHGRKSGDHPEKVILIKEFFEQIGVYREVKGISCELMALHFKTFDEMLRSFERNSSLRINFSPNDQAYSSGPLIVDYPFLGGRSFTDKVTIGIYKHIQESARKVIENFRVLRVKQK